MFNKYALFHGRTTTGLLNNIIINYTLCHDYRLWLETPVDHLLPVGTLYLIFYQPMVFDVW